MDASQERLERLLHLLGPGLWLHIDEAAFSSFFGGEIGNATAEQSAREFAEKRACIVVFEKRHAVFGRAYPQPDVK